MGAGERLAHVLQDRAIYLGKERGWGWWTGTHFDVSPESERLITRYAHRSMRTLTGMALKAIEEGSAFKQGPPKGWDATKKAALAKAGSVAAIRNALDVCAHHPAIATTAAQLNGDPYLLNVANGVLNLATQELTPHDPRHRMTGCSPYPWDPNADMSEWERVVLEMMQGDEQRVRFLQRAAGWTLTGEGTTLTQHFIHIYGGSNTGKGVFTRTLRRVIGDSLSLVCSFAMVGEASNGGPNSDLSQSEGKRYLLVPDTGGKPRWDGEVLKKLTGGDEVSCRELHKPSKRFTPQSTLWLCSNDKPATVGAGKHAVFNRILIVRFSQMYSQDPEKIRRGLALPMRPHLERELHESHGAGILRWMVEGARAYLDAGLGTCPAIERERLDYAEDMKVPLEEFTDEYIRTEFDDVEDGELAQEVEDWDDAYVTSADLHRGFTTWCERVGYERGREVTPKRITKNLHEIMDNVDRFSRVRRHNEFGITIVKGNRARAWRRMSWTREGVALLRDYAREDR